MWRSLGSVRPLEPADRAWALDVCAQDPISNVFVAARIVESGLSGARPVAYGYDHGGQESVCWASANIVPASAGPAALAAFAGKVMKRRRTASSVFGPADQVQDLWSKLGPAWEPRREYRRAQPVMTIGPGELPATAPTDEQVRPATLADLDAVVPAAAAMFTEEIGYPPYRGSDQTYRRGVASLITRGHTLIRTDHGKVVFKADLGSVALGVAQIQGVWLAPHLRGQGLAPAAMAAVVRYAQAHVAPTVTLYVNDYNSAAIATYRRVGFQQTGTFATILL
ncbi:GNAT family N-acetyltransferase [Ornithinimicrobium sp. Arc0846-15]|nr:GNAT family N-acetyltransferase [Ornithinimicrobium laminariae]